MMKRNIAAPVEDLCPSSRPKMSPIAAVRTRLRIAPRWTPAGAAWSGAGRDCLGLRGATAGPEPSAGSQLPGPAPACWKSAGRAQLLPGRGARGAGSLLHSSQVL